MDRKVMYKMDRNSWVNRTYHGFEPDWVENFWQISVWVNFWLGLSRTWFTRIESVVSQTHQPANKGSYTYFLLLYWILLLGRVRLFFLRANTLVIYIFVILVCICSLTSFWIVFRFYWSLFRF